MSVRDLTLARSRRDRRILSLPEGTRGECAEKKRRLAARILFSPRLEPGFEGLLRAELERLNEASR